MSKDVQSQRIDPRPPVWQRFVKGKVQIQKTNSVVFAKQKMAVRWNWTTKLEQPLGGKAV